MDPELLPGSGSGTRKIESWIRIRNKSFRIHNAACRQCFGSEYCNTGMSHTGTVSDTTFFAIRVFFYKEIPVDLRKIGLLDKKSKFQIILAKAIECQRLEKDASRAPFLCKLQNIDAC